jgi:hypothetical protein
MRKLIILWVASVATAAAISAGVMAQVQSTPPGDVRILTGQDIGFRVEGQAQERRRDPLTNRSSTVDLLTGHLVVRVNGQWIEAAILPGGGVRPATN